MDAVAVTALPGAGLERDNATVNAVDRAEVDDRPLTANVPQMLHLVFLTNLRHLSQPSKVTTNITCMQPSKLGLTSAAMSYLLDRPTTRQTITTALHQWI